MGRIALEREALITARVETLAASIVEKCEVSRCEG